LTQQLEQERSRLESQRKLEEDKRRQEDAQRKLLEERQSLEAEKQRLAEQARLAARQKTAEKKRHQEPPVVARHDAPAAAPMERPAAKSAEEGLKTAAKIAPAPALFPEPAAEPAQTERAENPQSMATARPPAAPVKSAAADQLASAKIAEARGDYGSVAAILRPLADRGDAGAQFRLAQLYEGGRGVSRNYNQAYIWYSLAARAGIAAAAADRDRVAGQLQPAEVRQADRLVNNWRVR